SDATFNHIVHQCAEHGTALRFIGWGEPLLHPKITYWIMKAHSYGLLTHLNTNGSKLDRIMAVRLVVAGLTSMKFSFQGVDRKSYREMRNIDWFDQLIETIGVMVEARGDKAFPWIALSTTITDETEEAVHAFKVRVGHLVNELSVGHTIFDFMDLSAVRLNDADRARVTIIPDTESQSLAATLARDYSTKSER
ncbi:hypothetical protein LCGC14_3109970, partial [marine sediment metagenome]